MFHGILAPFAERRKINMKRIQYSVYRRETGNAGGKAKNDVYDILLKEGFLPSYNPSKYQYIRVFQQLVSIFGMKKNTCLIVQYPAIYSKIIKVLCKKMKNMDSTTAIIHDLPSIQGVGGKPETEFKELSYFDNIIVHNRKMGEYLKSNGYRGRIVELELFDYLHDATREITSCNGEGIISIAGNLDKSKYILELNKIKKCRFNLYGINNTLDLSSVNNANYLGLLSSEEIVYKLEGDYGLVWDGDSITECSGIHGRYLKYNNPHKLSLYIAAGKPVITWKKAAIADFVEKENIGITVDSLEELNNIDLKREYWDKRKNVLKLKKRIAEGYYTKKAIRLIYE